MAAALALAGAAAGAAPAVAHANYVRSNPAADARLVKPPSEVRVAFSEPPDPRASALTVLDVNGARVDRHDTASSGEPNGLRVSLQPIGDGGYTVAWTAVSAVDGHETKGSFAFAVGNAPLPALPDVQAAPPPTALEVAGRALSYAGIALALGVAFFTLRVHLPAGASEEGRERDLFRAAAVLIAAGSAFLVLQQGPLIPPRLALLLGVRGLGGLAVAVAAWGPVRPTLRRDIALGAALVGAVTATGVSHAAALDDAKEMLLDLAHIVAVGIWAGGLVGLLWIVLRGPDRAGLGRIAWRFSLVALVAVAVIVTTGTLQSLDRLVLVQDLWETPYGLALLAKILLLAATLVFGALNLARYGPRGERRALLRSTIAETAILACVIVAASALTALAPPALATGAAFDQTQEVDGYRLELVVPTAIPGRNRYVLRVHQGLTPVTDVEKVELRFTMVEHDMGQSELVAAQRGPGEYVAEGSPTSMFGTWKVQTIIRPAGREDVRALFTVPIALGDQKASAVALSANAYSLVVFPDPTTPLAGAPITLNIVVVDRQGNPASGQAVTATLRGGASAPAPLAASEVGPGRYRADIAALDAGKWTAHLTVGSAANGADYSFEVTP